MKCTAVLWRFVFPSLVMLAFPSYAHAHAGMAEHGFLHGLLHPLTGLDHVCAMVAVGLWAAQIGGNSMWRLPLAFISIMVLGGLLGIVGISMPFVEGGIAASLLVLGLLIAAAVHMPLVLAGSMVSVFALFHGLAHSATMPLDVSWSGYVAGGMLATAMLHAGGLALGLLAHRYGRMQWLRFAGIAVATCGGILMTA